MQTQFSGEKLMRKHPAHAYQTLEDEGLELCYTLENEDAYSRLLIEVGECGVTVGRANYWLIDQRLYQYDLNVLPRCRGREIPEAIKLFARDFFGVPVEDVWKDDFAEEMLMHIPNYSDAHDLHVQY